MTLKISFGTEKEQKTGTLVLLVPTGGKLSPFGRGLDEQTGGQISRAIKASDFKARSKQSLVIAAPANTRLSRIIIMGTGNCAGITHLDGELLGGAIYAVLQGQGAGKAVVSTSLEGKCALDATEFATALASGMRLRAYRFGKYRTTQKDDEKSPPKAITILTGKPARAGRLYQTHEAIAAGVHLARDLVNEPPNILTPVAFAARVRKLTSLGLKVEILTARKLKELGMGALLGVAEGSQLPARVAIMHWQGGKKDDRPLAFVGKGVTFDSGGISLKPGAGMGDMKGDMGGAACVTGLLAALAGRKARVNAVGVVGLVENMPGGKAQRPGDIVTSMSGKTIAVLNTDAEGRLVLADCLWYTQQRFKPRFMINLATLTGAIMVALGKEYAGLFSNNDELAERLAGAGGKTGEKVWRMPLDKSYDKLIDSKVADMKNIGGRFAGAITAAQFLQRHVNDVPWAHLDIAGTAMDSAKNDINRSWGSGWGVRLLNRLVADYYE